MAVSTTDTYNCNVSCTGLYADIEFTDDQVLSDSIHKEVAEVLARGNCYTLDEAQSVLIKSETSQTTDSEELSQIQAVNMKQ